MRSSSLQYHQKHVDEVSLKENEAPCATSSTRRQFQLIVYPCHNHSIEPGKHCLKTPTTTRPPHTIANKLTSALGSKTFTTNADKTGKSDQAAHDHS